MLFQYVLKGIPGLSDADALAVFDTGLLCRWWRRVGLLPAAEVSRRLTEDELMNHLARYHEKVPGESYTYGQNTPFISTTAGTYQTPSSRTYKHFSAEWTAIRFATDTFRTDGVVFTAWLPVLGRPALALQGFAEELRDPNQYPTAYGYHHQGEVAAKIQIPPAQIKSFARYSGPLARAALKAGKPIEPVAPPESNLRFVAPEEHSNVRDVV